MFGVDLNFMAAHKKQKLLVPRVRLRIPAIVTSDSGRS